MTITNEHRLTALKKALRETSHTVKPMVETDKKKQANKTTTTPTFHPFTSNAIFTRNKANIQK